MVEILLCIPKSKGGLGPEPDENAPPYSHTQLKIICVAMLILSLIFAGSMLYITFGKP